MEEIRGQLFDCPSETLRREDYFQLHEREAPSSEAVTKRNVSPAMQELLARLRFLEKEYEEEYEEELIRLSLEDSHSQETINAFGSLPIYPSGFSRSTPLKKLPVDPSIGLAL